MKQEAKLGLIYNRKASWKNIRQQKYRPNTSRKLSSNWRFWLWFCGNILWNLKHIFVEKILWMSWSPVSLTTRLDSIAVLTWEGYRWLQSLNIELPAQLSQKLDGISICTWWHFGPVLLYHSFPIFNIHFLFLIFYQNFNSFHQRTRRMKFSFPFSIKKIVAVAMNPRKTVC